MAATIHSLKVPQLRAEQGSAAAGRIRAEAERARPLPDEFAPRAHRPQASLLSAGQIRVPGARRAPHRQQAAHRLGDGHPRGDRLSQVDDRADARNAARRGVRRARQHVRRLPRHLPGPEAQFRLRGHLATDRGGTSAGDRPDAAPQVADRHRRHRRRRDRDQVLDRHDQSLVAHQHGAGTAARPGDDGDGPGLSRLLSGGRARTSSAPPAGRSRARFRRGRRTRVPGAAGAGAPRRLRHPRSPHQALPHHHAGGADPGGRYGARAGQHQHLHHGRAARQDLRPDRGSAARDDRQDRTGAGVHPRPRARSTPALDSEGASF